MRRREFIAVLGGAMLPSPVCVHGQERRTIPSIGFLGPTTASLARERVAAFERRLQELGWVIGETVAINYQWAEGRTERFREIAAEFNQQKPNVLVTWGTETAQAAKQATSHIPIVFTIVGDPVGSGLVDSLRRPGGNITGLSTQHADSAGKRLDLLREVVPTLRRLAILTNAHNTGSLAEMNEIEGAARSVGVSTTKLEVRRVEEIGPAIAALSGQVDALLVAADAVLNTNRVLINTSALSARLPTMHGFRDIVEAGGLMSYAPDYFDLFRRTADYVDKVLGGSKPSDLPVEQPTKFELVINLKTANALGLTIPPTLVARADEVIE